jgi:hypothetical protein
MKKGLNSLQVKDSLKLSVITLQILTSCVLIQSEIAKR